MNSWRTVGLLFVLPLISTQSAAMSCNELGEFLQQVAIARALNPAITPARMKQILREDQNYTANEKVLLGKYIDRSFTKADAAEGAFVHIDPRDCKK